MTRSTPTTTSKDLVQHEHALAFCFDVLSTAGSLDFASLSNLLRPWGWSRNALLDRFHELQQSGLVLVEPPCAGSRDPGVTICITSEGRRLSEGAGLPCRRPSPALSTEQASDTIEAVVSGPRIQSGSQS
ncbi:MAG: hypothetical protein WA982_05750 [Rubrobacteraceae bacterium]